MPSGFLPTTRPSTFMLDVVVLAMVVILPVLTWSIRLARRRQFALHRRVQLVLASLLLVTVLLFEIDIRLDDAWWARAQGSPFHARGVLRPLLIIHLCFSVSTAILWVWTVVGAVRRFPNPPRPGEYSRTHRRLAWSAAIGMYATALTGWTFYWMAFVAQ